MAAPTPPIDYTNLGYDSMREAMLALARERLPEWTDFSQNDIGVLLVELYAYACDITLYHQTRIAANLLPETSDEPEALIQMLRLIGYELAPPAPATANLRVAFDAAEVPPIAIPAGTQFFATLPSGEQLTFETERDIMADLLTPPDSENLRYFSPVPVVEGRTIGTELLGASDGSPNQMFTLRQNNVIPGSPRVTVSEPGGDTRWEQVETLARSTPADRHFILQRDAEGASVLLFGDGVNGLIPPAGSAVSPVNINVRYRIGGGPLGNVSANTEFSSGLAAIRRAANLKAAGGGAPREDVNRARSFAPRLFRTQERAVTPDDYRDLALLVPGVGKALAVAPSWNQVVLYVAPSGQVAEPSELLKRDLLSFFETRRMATVNLKIVGPRAADVYLRAEVRAEPHFLQSQVQASVERAVAEYLDFEYVEFGQQIYLSRIYDVIQSLPQVASLLVTQFSRSPDGGVDADGTLALGPHELPRPGYRDNPNTPPDPSLPAVRPPIAIQIKGGVAS